MSIADIEAGIIATVADIAAYFRVNACDRLERQDALKAEFANDVWKSRCISQCPLRDPQVNVEILSDGCRVSRASDFILYSVEAEAINRVVELYGPCRSLCMI